MEDAFRKQNTAQCNTAPAQKHHAGHSGRSRSSLHLDAIDSIEKLIEISNSLAFREPVAAFSYLQLMC